IVWHFGLIEINPPAIAIPNGLIFLAMFDKQPIQGDVVAIDNQAVLVRIRSPTRAPPMIRAPQPEIISHHIAAIDRDHARGRTGLGSTRPAENVPEKRGILGVRSAGTGITNLQKRWRVGLPGFN